MTVFLQKGLVGAWKNSIYLVFLELLQMSSQTLQLQLRNFVLMSSLLLVLVIIMTQEYRNILAHI